MPGWQIYRDSTYGMYALHEELELDINLMIWNITLNDPNLEYILEDIRTELTKREAEERESLERVNLDPQRKITTRTVEA